MTEPSPTAETAAPAPANDPGPAPQAPAVPPQGALRVVNFIEEVLGNFRAPEVKAILDNLEALTRKAVGLGFPEEQARRALDIWLMDTAWTHILNGTSLKMQTFFAMTGAPAIIRPRAAVLGPDGAPLPPSIPPVAPQGDEQPEAPDAVAVAAAPATAMDVVSGPAPAPQAPAAA